MTPARLFLIVVLVLVIYGISLALVGRQSDEPADLSSPWLARLKARFVEDRPVRIEDEMISDLRQGGRLVLRAGLLAGRVAVRTNDDRRVREVSLRSSGPDVLELDYTPARHGDEFVDRGARPIHVETLRPNTPARLVFLRHGGDLAIRRKTALGPVVIDQP